MRTQTSDRDFIEILEDEIRNDLRREIEAEILARSPAAQAQKSNAAASGRFEAWLASHVAPVKFKTPRKPYGTPSKPTAGAASAESPAVISSAPLASPAPRRLQAKTAAEIVAVELLNRYSTVRLVESFSEDELKAVWRKAAMKTHPDRFAGQDQITIVRMTATFRELSEAYSTLLALFDAAESTAA